jgi:hypothetical protein
MGGSCSMKGLLARISFFPSIFPWNCN